MWWTIFWAFVVMWGFSSMIASSVASAIKDHTFKCECSDHDETDYDDDLDCPSPEY